MGIVNVTPDSFSDGGQFLDPQRAVEHGLALLKQVADLLDVGGESTRPYSTSVSESEELRRVLPVIARLCEQTGVPVSIDTSKAAVAREALAAGAEIINDITAIEGDPEMLAVAAQAEAGVRAMHMQGTPQTMQESPTYADVVEEILAYLVQRRDACGLSGSRGTNLPRPGDRFRQDSPAQSHAAGQLPPLSCCGLSAAGGALAKGFIGKVLGNREADRRAGTVGAAFRWPGRGCRSSASTTSAWCGTPCCFSRPPAASTVPPRACRHNDPGGLRH